MHFPRSSDEKAKTFAQKRESEVFGGLVAGIWRHPRSGQLWMGFLRRRRSIRPHPYPGCRKFCFPGFWPESGLELILFYF